MREGLRCRFQVTITSQIFLCEEQIEKVLLQNTSGLELVNNMQLNMDEIKFKLLTNCTC